MKRWLVVSLLLIALYTFWQRKNLFFRDPLAIVLQDGKSVEGVQAFVNVDRELLLEKDGADGFLYVLRHGMVLRAPETLQCIRYIVCRTTKDAPAIDLAGAEVNSMTSTEVRFRDGGHKEMLVRFD